MPRFSPLYALLLGATACGGPQRQGVDGATCFRDDECAFGLVCTLPAGGTARVCTTDVTGLISLVDAGLPQAGSAGSSAGGAAAGGASAGSAGKAAGGAAGSSAGGSASAAGGTAGGA